MLSPLAAAPRARWCSQSGDLESGIARHLRFAPIAVQPAVQLQATWKLGQGVADATLLFARCALARLHSPGKRRDMKLARLRLKRFMTSMEVQQAICALILMDSAAVFGECVVDAVIDDRKDVAGTWLHAAHLLDRVLETLGLFLLLIFAVELAAMVFSLGPSFLRSPIYTLDLTMVSATLLEELVKPLVGRRLEHSFALMLRIWRVLRVAHGVYMVMFLKQERLEKEVFDLRTRVARLECEVQTGGLQRSVS